MNQTTRRGGRRTARRTIGPRQVLAILAAGVFLVSALLLAGDLLRAGREQRANEELVRLVEEGAEEYRL